MMTSTIDKTEKVEEPLLFQEYKTTPLRWAILFSVATIYLTGGLIIVAFAPVAIQIAQAYNLSSTMPVNMCALAFAFCSPPADILAVYLYGKYRVDTVMRLSMVVSFIGAMFRFLTIYNGEFWPILAGTFIMASVASLFLNSQILIANRWFSDKERAFCLSVLNTATPLGQICSFALTGVVFANIDSSLTPLEIDLVTKDSMRKLLLLQNIPYIFFFITF